jgi:hypothetical protein
MAFLDGKVLDSVQHLTCVNELAHQLWEHLGDMAATEGALEVRELDDSDSCLLVAELWGVIHRDYGWRQPFNRRR